MKISDLGNVTARMRTRLYPLKQCRLYRLSSQEMVALVARGLGVMILPLRLDSEPEEPMFPPGLDLLAGAAVCEMQAQPDGSYLLKVAHPDWPALAEGHAYPIVRDVPEKGMAP